MRRTGLTLAEVAVALCVAALAILPIFTALQSSSSQIYRGINHYQAQFLISELYQQLNNLGITPGFEGLIAPASDLKQLLESCNDKLSDKNIINPRNIRFPGAQTVGLLVSPLPENFVNRQFLVERVFDSSSGELSHDWYKVTIKVVWNEPDGQEAALESYAFLGVRP
ncbi:MAG: hypothetical protein CVV42_19315 [Candidatus Riflebacteria bacterium HGW-Riflebacteria-2]|jgi:hypothetical protein|nr:MAG: hypothetical protein CVV42_19315 [Candidatus Riflebacteria bacterium HGW-Riflebacteria-2]